MRLRIILLLTVAALDLGAATLLWDANPTNDLVTGYNVHRGTNSGDYSSVTNVGTNTSVRFFRLPPVTNFFAVTAYRTWPDGETLESRYSMEVSYFRVPMPYTNPPRSLTMLVPTNKWWIIRGPTLGTMTNWYSVTGPTNVVLWTTNGPSMFLARKAFFTSLAKVASKGAGTTTLTDAKAVPLRTKRKKTAIKAVPVLGPSLPAPSPAPSTLPSPIRTNILLPGR